MARRRQFGSIRRLQSGRYQVHYRDPDDDARKSGPTLFATKGEASRWLAELETSLGTGTYLSPELGKVTFGEHAQTWLNSKANLRPTTHELYTYLLRVHLLPTFGKIRLDAINPATIRVWHSALMNERGLSQTSAAKAYRLLRQILQVAVDDRVIRENPCRLKGAATERSRERSIPTLAEVAAVAEAINPRFNAMVWLAALAGLRRGECLGLARKHLKLDDQPTVTVERSLVETERFGTMLQDPKTNAGHRTVALPESLARILRDHLDAYVGRDPEAFVFTTALSGRPPSDKTWKSTWDKARRGTGVQFTFHDLRHHAGTLNAQAGATLKEAMARLGHASADAALRYQHAVASRDTVIASAIDDLVRAERSA